MNGWRVFFRVAALFNLAVGLLMLFAPNLFYQWLLIDQPVGVEAKVYMDLFAVLVITFGWAYWTISRDPPAHRDLVLMGIIGKTLVVIVGWYHALAGTGSMNLALVTLADLVFALLFLRFYLLSRS